MEDWDPGELEVEIEFAKELREIALWDKTRSF